MSSSPAALIGRLARDERLRRAETIGRSLGDEHFIASLESATGRVLRLGKRGPKPRPVESAEDDLCSALSP